MTPSLQRLLLIAALLGGASYASAQQTTEPATSPKEIEDNAKPSDKVEEERGTVRLEALEVTGSRIRRVDFEGPSPVDVYDTEYIRATGAMTLADFMNYLPQNYTGIGAGRGSAPNELNPEFGQRTETSLPFTNFVLGAANSTPGQTGVSGASLRGLGAGSTLVLVDGRPAARSGAGNRSTDSRQGFVDLNTIPLGMVERIEVITDGASAIYGADAVGGVINVILKKNWQGNELSATFKGAEHGGGRERSVTLTSGFAHGKLRGTLSATYYDRSALKASQRDFSNNQDHSGIVVHQDPVTGAPIYGRDLRLLWGYPAVVQAFPLNGEFSALPGVRVVLVPEGATGTPGISGFIPTHTIIPPATVVNASGQRRGNTAEFIDLIPESKRWGLNGNFTYSLTEKIDLYGNLGFNDTRGFYNTQPAVSSASATSGFGNFATRVPAAFNPFNQDVIVGMIHYGFGSVWQKTHTKAFSSLFGARGQITDTWVWDSAVSYQRNENFQVSRLFNGAAVSAPLANGTLNPFIDARAVGAPDQSAVYETMALYPTILSKGRQVSWDFNANGDIVDIWGGPIQGAFGGVYTKFENQQNAVNYSTAINPIVTRSDVTGSEISRAAFAELSVPFFGKPNAVPGLRRLELNLAGRYEDYGKAGSTTVPKIGFTWAPVQPLLLRANFSEGFRAPALTEYQVANTTSTATLLDPRRTPPSTTGIQVTRGQNSNIAPETSQHEFYGAIFEPPFIKGLTLSVNYYRTTQENVIQTLSGQVIVNNEAIFGDRITRAAADANDIALGQPGRITGVDLTFVNFGKVQNESLDFVVDYILPWEDFGRWRLSTSASKTLKSTRELAPGQPAFVDEGDTFAPPEWRVNASIFWNLGRWNAALLYTYTDGFSSNQAGNTFTLDQPVASAYKVDVRGGYEFTEGVWRGHGKGLRVQVGVGNVFDKKPPFADTIFGYNGGLHGGYALGRSYELSFMLPF